MSHGMLTPEQKALITGRWREVGPDTPASDVTLWAFRVLGRRIGATTARLLRPAAPTPADAPAPARGKGDHLTDEDREKIRGLWKQNPGATGAVVAALATELFGRGVGAKTVMACRGEPRSSRPRTPARPVAERLGYESPIAGIIDEGKKTWKRLRRGMARGRASA